MIRSPSEEEWGQMWRGNERWERLPGQLQAEQLLSQEFGRSSNFSSVPPSLLSSSPLSLFLAAQRCMNAVQLNISNHLSSSSWIHAFVSPSPSYISPSMPFAKPTTHTQSGPAVSFWRSSLMWQQVGGWEGGLRAGYDPQALHSTANATL